MNNYIRLNNNDNHLSLGNIFNAIKKISINKSSAIQTEIFCTIFNVDTVSETTVGNYCTGYRTIGNSYKQTYLNYSKKYSKDKTILVNTINDLLSIIDGYIYNMTEIDELNNIESLKRLCQIIHIYAKNDLYVSTNLKKELLSYLENKSYYEFICQVLFFAILEKPQPLFEKDSVNTTIDEILTNTNLSVNNLKEYLLIKFKEGISLIPSLKKLAEKDNPYALHELGNLEYNGIIAGYPRYEEAFNYHKLAAELSHPTSCWMISHMILQKQIGSLNESDISEAWKYLKKALELNSISALNTAGICYLHGYTNDKKINTDLAISYFQKAADKNYVYAYNNLGKIYEEKKDIKKAFSYYQKSADMEESWACNKVGLYYYQHKEYQEAFNYFTKGANAPISNRKEWNTYNLVKLFYLKGNSSLGIKKDLHKSIDMLNTIKDFPSSNELFLYCYYELYKTSQEKKYLDKCKYYLDLVNNTFDDVKLKEIAKELQNINKYKITLDLN